MKIYWEHVENETWISQSLRMFDGQYHLKVERKDSSWFFSLEHRNMVVLKDVPLGINVQTTSEALEFAPHLLASIFSSLADTLTSANAETFDSRMHGT